MFSAFERMMAFRYLRARKAEGFVSVIAGFSFLGILLGVATLIIVMSVMNGFRTELFSRILGLNGHLNAFTPGQIMTNYDPIAQKILQVNGVTQVIPQIEGQGLLTVAGGASGVLVRGISMDSLQRKPVLSKGLVEGDTNAFQGPAVAIGVKMAERLGLVLGDEITLMAPKGRTSPFGTIPVTRRFVVEVIFDVGMYEYNNGFIFMPLDEARKFYQLPENAVSSLEIMTRDLHKLPEVKQRVIDVVDGHAQIYDWRDANSSFVNALEVERNVMFLILTLIILVAAFNIISSMIMLVKDKSRDIAIMRTMGASSSSMLRVFILTGASIGFLGTAFGAGLGVLFTLNIEAIRGFLERLSGTELFADEIYFLSKLPAIVEWSEVLSVVGMALVISILATLYPAWRASRLNPVEALRYE